MDSIADTVPGSLSLPQRDPGRRVAAAGAPLTKHRDTEIARRPPQPARPVNIRTLLLLLVMSLLVPAMVAAVWTVTYTYRTENSLLERNLRDSTRALSMVVDAELSKRASIAKALASSSLLDAGAEISADDLARFEIRARQALVDSGAWVELSAGDVVLMSTQPSPPPGRAAPHPGAIWPMNEMSTIVPLHQTADDKFLRAAVIEPVQRDGRTLMSVAVTVLPADLQRIIDQQNLPGDWVASILDSRSTVVARFPGGDAYAGRPATRDLKAQIANRQEGLFESISLDGNPMIGFFSTSPQGWTYVSAMPQPTSLLGLPLSVLNVALCALGLLMLGTVAALWVSRRISAPIDALKRSAEKMQSGLAIEKSSTGIAEFDGVADALADASAAMQGAQADLQRQVASAVQQTQAAEKRVSQSRRVEALGRLTGGVAHDFNNVLGIISNSAHLMQRDHPASEQRAPLAAMLRAVDVGSRLTQYMMRFAGRQPVQPKPVQLQQYMQEVRDLIGIVLGKRITLLVSVDDDVPAVRVDTSELELALINLALNARDALPAGGQVSIEVRPARDKEVGELDDAPGPYVVILFSDSGPGIDPHALEHVFEPFFTTKAAGKGTGLGLSQVHGFSVQAGGKALVASSEAGTIVSLVLPACSTELDQGDAQDLAGAKKPQASAIVGARVLLVEDNDELADVTVALLESFGSVVRRAASASAALDMVEQDPSIELVLSDVVMPGEMDGLAMARRLRKVAPQLPVVLISGYSSAFTEAHEFLVLHKPCGADELHAALATALCQRAAS